MYYHYQTVSVIEKDCFSSDKKIHGLEVLLLITLYVTCGIFSISNKITSILYKLQLTVNKLVTH